ncbi:MAG TPA: hemerythrin domain-containing protein [Methanomassiliicoccales archaeon]|jgi:hemerythrin-like domain-containing protein
MMPIGPLMIEHRLIERAIKQMAVEIDRAKTQGRFDVGFIDSWVDFIRTYADQAHHGKEEQILFHDLADRPLSPALKLMMDGLIEDHVKARKMVAELVSVRERYGKGDAAAFDQMMAIAVGLVDFYPPHIRKEDQEFFIPVMDYFTKEEKDAMIQRFHEFDETVIHEHYRSVVERMESRAIGNETI